MGPFRLCKPARPAFSASLLSQPSQPALSNSLIGRERARRRDWPCSATVREAVAQRLHPACDIAGQAVARQQLVEQRQRTCLITRADQHLRLELHGQRGKGRVLGDQRIEPREQARRLSGIQLGVSAEQRRGLGVGIAAAGFGQRLKRSRSRSVSQRASISASSNPATMALPPLLPATRR